MLLTLWMCVQNAKKLHYSHCLKIILTKHLRCFFNCLSTSLPHSSSARGDHWCDRGGVHSGSPLHQQDQVGGEVHGEALPSPGEPSDGVSPQDGGDWQRAVLVSPPHFTGEDTDDVVDSIIWIRGMMDVSAGGTGNICKHLVLERSLLSC